MKIGDRYNFLTALEDTGRKSGSNARWKFLCDCGKTHECVAASVKRGLTKSCGCIRGKTANNLKHGKTGTQEYRLWRGIRNRCYNSDASHYKRYGARGIKMCARWQNFENFLADMGSKPSGMSLERIDNNGDYEPDNCRWATPREQANNRSNNRRITFDGVTMNVNEWAAKLGISTPTLIRRLNKGWSIDRALKTPVRKWKAHENL